MVKISTNYTLIYDLCTLMFVQLIAGGNITVYTLCRKQKQLVSLALCKVQGIINLQLKVAQ